MSAKASADFGLYKEKIQENRARSIKFVLVVLGGAIVGFGVMCGVLQVIKASHKTDDHQDATPGSATVTDKLVASESVKREAMMNLTPKPFGVTLRGQAPQEFSSTTEKITTLSYPRQSNHRHRNYPKNIQDVIGHPSRYPRPSEFDYDDLLKHNRRYKVSPSQYVVKNHDFYDHDHDPFHSYKPEDPSDINLLSTGNFRFAPPAWSTIKTKLPKVYHQQQLEDTKNREVLNPKPRRKFRPLTLTLNVYPTDGRPAPSPLPPNHKILPQQHFEPRLKGKPERMVIHLNLYHDMGGAMRETRLKKKFAPPRAKA